MSALIALKRKAHIRHAPAFHIFVPPTVQDCVHCLASPGASLQSQWDRIDFLPLYRHVFTAAVLSLHKIRRSLITSATHIRNVQANTPWIHFTLHTSIRSHAEQKIMQRYNFDSHYFVVLVYLCVGTRIHWASAW